jgi:hypothetical protein
MAAQANRSADVITEASWRQPDALALMRWRSGSWRPRLEGEAFLAIIRYGSADVCAPQTCANTRQ